MSALQTVENRDTGSHQVATINPHQLISMAVEQNADVDKLEKLMVLAERWEASEAKKAFVRAMGEFKAKAIKITKDQHVNYTSSKGTTDYRHASLGHICDELGAALGDVGISYRWFTEQLDGGWIRVSCILTHHLGHSEETSLQGPPDQSGGKNVIQAVGSTVSYLERYTLLAATGTAVAEMDDDGQGGAPVQQQRQQTQQSARQDQPSMSGDPLQTINQGQQKQLLAAARAKGFDEADICTKARVSSLAEIPVGRFEAAKNHYKNMEAPQ